MSEIDAAALLASKDEIKTEACTDQVGWRVVCGSIELERHDREARALSRAGELNTWRNQARAILRKAKLAARDAEPALVTVDPKPENGVPTLQGAPEGGWRGPEWPQVPRGSDYPGPVLERTGDA